MNKKKIYFINFIGRYIKTFTFLLIYMAHILFPSLYVWANDYECEDVLIIFARGSGQPQGEDEDSLREKPERVAFFKGIGDLITSDEISTKYQEVNYRAAGGWNHFSNAEWNWFKMGNYRDSVSEGTTDIKTKLEIQNIHCPDQNFVLGGYSQGAHVVGDALFELRQEVKNKIIYVALFGDPKFKQDSYAALGTYKRYTHSAVQQGGILEPREQEFPTEFKGRLHSWCRRDDGICENNGSKLAKGSGSTHYFYPNLEIPIAANAAALRIRKNMGEPFIPPEFTGYPMSEKLDIVFAVDALSFNNAKANSAALRGRAEGILNKAKNLSQDTRFGFVAYRDGVFVDTVVDFTDSAESIKGALGNVLHRGTRSALFSGLSKPLGLSWREDARKVVVLIPFAVTDETPSGLNLGTIINAYQNAGVSIYPVVYESSSPTALATFNALASQTGGLSFQLNRYITLDPGFMTENMLNVMATSSEVYAGRAVESRPGLPTQFSLASLHDPASDNKNYWWYFTPGNKHDLVTHSPQASYVYSSPFEGLVTVKIREGNSTKGQVAIPVKVTPDAALPLVPQPPRNIKVDVIERSSQIAAVLSTLAAVRLAQSLPTQTIRISWDAPLAAAADGYKVYTASGELLGITSPDQTSVVIKDVPMDANLNLQVATIGESGTSNPEQASEINEPLPPPEPEQPPVADDPEPEEEAVDDTEGAKQNKPAVEQNEIARVIKTMLGANSVLANQRMLYAGYSISPKSSQAAAPKGGDVLAGSIATISLKSSSPPPCPLLLSFSTIALIVAIEYALWRRGFIK